MVFQNQTTVETLSKVEKRKKTRVLVVADSERSPGNARRSLVNYDLMIVGYEEAVKVANGIGNQFDALLCGELLPVNEEERRRIVEGHADEQEYWEHLLANLLMGMSVQEQYGRAKTAVLISSSHYDDYWSKGHKQFCPTRTEVGWRWGKDPCLYKKLPMVKVSGGEGKDLGDILRHLLGGTGETA